MDKITVGQLFEILGELVALDDYIIYLIKGNDKSYLPSGNWYEDKICKYSGAIVLNFECRLEVCEICINIEKI